MSERIGQLLSKLSTLSPHDVEEILEEQKTSHHLFGDTAIALGMVTPEQVWRAWSHQLRSTNETVNLDLIGIDTQSFGLIPFHLIRELNIIPVRVIDDQLIVASEGQLTWESIETLSNESRRQVIIAYTQPGQVTAAITRYFSNPSLYTEAA